MDARVRGITLFTAYDDHLNIRNGRAGTWKRECRRRVITNWINGTDSDSQHVFIVPGPRHKLLAELYLLVIHY